MPVLVFAESPNGLCKKVAFEAVTYAKKSADILGTSCHALTLGSPSNGGELGLYGAAEVINVPLSDLHHLDGLVVSDLIVKAARAINAHTIVLSHTSTGKTIAGTIAVKLDGGLVSAVTSLPTADEAGFCVDRMVFSGKAIATYRISEDFRILSILPNAFPAEISGDSVTPKDLSFDLLPSRLAQVEVTKQTGTVPLPEAELVVSGGRGFKGPENWGILEELAEELGAGTACSRPVADSGWRPHHEHVGQTGVAIAPNLYIAIGISGAIQHLGGVNNSKTIVVINKDPEAPFFKAADFGVVGDLFDVVPRLTEAVRRHKSS